MEDLHSTNSLPERAVVLANFHLRAAALLSGAASALFLKCSGTSVTGVLCGVGMFLTAFGATSTSGTSTFVLTFWFDNSPVCHWHCAVQEILSAAQ